MKTLKRSKQNGQSSLGCKSKNKLKLKRFGHFTPTRSNKAKRLPKKRKLSLHRSFTPCLPTKVMMLRKVGGFNFVDGTMCSARSRSDGAAQVQRAKFFKVRVGKRAEAPPTRASEALSSAACFYGDRNRSAAVLAHALGLLAEAPPTWASEALSSAAYKELSPQGGRRESCACKGRGVHLVVSGLVQTPASRRRVVGTRLRPRHLRRCRLLCGSNQCANGPPSENRTLAVGASVLPRCESGPRFGCNENRTTASVASALLRQRFLLKQLSVISALVQACASARGAESYHTHPMASIR